MTVAKFIEKISSGHSVGFEETMQLIDANYRYFPTLFSNGLGEDLLVNEPGTNEGSCKIFAFARMHDLDEERTLGLFGDYYRRDVLENPHGEGHRNIRNFIKYGWEGISFDGQALLEK
ncbi:MAG: HopJ type III effector protein [Gammaproteobacteria bacterium]